MKEFSKLFKLVLLLLPQKNKGLSKLSINNKNRVMHNIR